MNKFQDYSVLVVDDDMESLESMIEYLSIEFSIVYKANNIKDALKITLEKKPDMIFTDISMPDGDGFCLIEQIFAKGIKTPIVIISAYDDKEKLLKAIKLDIVDYLVKPLNSKKLKETMELCSKKLKLSQNEIYLKEKFSWHKEKSILLKDGKLVRLTKGETRLLQILIKNINTPVESVDIFYYLWDYEHKEYNPKNIRNIIYKLRKKLNSNDFIGNIYGSKYMISDKK